MYFNIKFLIMNCVSRAVPFPFFKYKLYIWDKRNEISIEDRLAIYENEVDCRHGLDRLYPH